MRARPEHAGILTLCSFYIRSVTKARKDNISTTQWLQLYDYKSTRSTSLTFSTFLNTTHTRLSLINNSPFRCRMSQKPLKDVLKARRAEISRAILGIKQANKPIMLIKSY